MVRGSAEEKKIARSADDLPIAPLGSGSDFSQVIKTTVFLKDMKDFAAMNELYGKSFAPEGVVAPARSTVQVAGLPKDALVEIDCVAVFPNP